MKRTLIAPRIRVMKVLEPEVNIFDEGICKLCYLAALVDGEGGIEIHKRDLNPLIRIGMKSLLPVELCKKYGGVITKSYSRKGEPVYTWNINRRELLRDFVKSIMPYSKIKVRQLELVLEAIKILDVKPLRWKDRIRKIKAEIDRLNEKPPPDINLEEIDCAHASNFNN